MGRPAQAHGRAAAGRIGCRESPRGWPPIADRHATPQHALETGELLAAIREAIYTDLSAHQRDVLVATTINEVPIDVLAERLTTTRGALYKTLHDARRKLRSALATRGLAPNGRTESRAS